MPVYRRAGTQFLWLKWTDRFGSEQRASSETNDEDEARALLDEIVHQEREAAKQRSGAGGALTVQRFFDETWLPLRQGRRPSAWRTDRSNLQTHFLPRFGGRPLARFATDASEVELLDWLGACPRTA